MNNYVFIESRDPSEAADVHDCFNLARQLASDGDQVTIFLVQNGVLRARTGAASEMLDPLIDAGVTLIADDFSVRERGIGPDQLRAGVAASPLEAVIDGMAAGATTVWN